MKKFLSLLVAVAMILTLAACSAAPAANPTQAPSDEPEATAQAKVLRVGMECAYAPYNWTQPDDSNGAVPIFNSAEYANGYDVMMAKAICEANGWTLEVHKMDWDSIPLAVQSGAIDCGICGQSITAERLETMDFSTPYYYASIVTLVKADGPYADAAGISDLAGATCTSQINTVWYDTCLPQIENANILAAQETAPAMLVSLEAGACDLVCTDEPTAMAACAVYSDLKLLNFTGTDDDYEVSEEEINIGVSIQKGNTELANAINAVLAGYTPEDFTEMMNSAIAIQPLSE